MAENESIVLAEGSHLFTNNGRMILDFSNGGSIVGHCHPDIIGEQQQSLCELDYTPRNMPSYTLLQLAKNIETHLPFAQSNSFFLPTATEAVETAMRLAETFTGRSGFIAHNGNTGGYASASGGNPLAGHIAFPAPDDYAWLCHTGDGVYDRETVMDYGWAYIDSQGANAAAFVIEPTFMACGVLSPPRSYLKRLIQECKKRGILTIVDGAQPGICRTGEKFTFSIDETIPDILILSTLGCGLQISSVSVSMDIVDWCRRAGFQFTTSYPGIQCAAASAKKLLELSERERLCQRATQRGQQLKSGLLQMKDKHWCIGDIRGQGLLLALEITTDWGAQRPAITIARAVLAKAMELGLRGDVLELPQQRGVITLSPPLTITVEEAMDALKILDSAFALIEEEEREMEFNSVFL